ncbi:MAG: DUF3253 domain-containing protein [Gemmatimonadota bacterium]|jgi:hypothetical protein
MATPSHEKICATCGRRFGWRKRWAHVWDEVRYCSRACRGGPSRLDRELEFRLRELLADRSPGATLCPSELARAVFPEEIWRREMERVRRAGRRLAARGEVEVMQGGRVVDFSDARGPIRYRAARR